MKEEQKRSVLLVENHPEILRELPKPFSREEFLRRIEVLLGAGGTELSRERTRPPGASGSGAVLPLSDLAGRVERVRVLVGTVPVDPVRFGDAVGRIRALRDGGGGAVFTPNVDHVVQAQNDPLLRKAYARAELSFADGQPVVWACRALGNPVLDKVSGSDLLSPLMDGAARWGWRVFLLGGAPGVAEEAAAKLRESGVKVVGTLSPTLPTLPEEQACAAIVEAIGQTRPDLVVVALGAPKQELLIDAVKERLRPAVLIGLGASLDFLVGRVPRAPRWMSSFGLEWLFRLGREPRRLWRRYLVRDPAFFRIILRQAVTRRRKVPV